MALKPFVILNELLQTYFYKPDLQAVRIVLGTINAHYLRVGDPAWLFVVAPPGTGKTTITIMGASELPEVIPLSDVTENTFLSGFYGHKEPGLLERLGETTQQGNTYITEGGGILLVKDFTTVLCMRREKRAAILSQLREIHDGEFRRQFGTGVTKVWRGRVGMVAAVTPALDRHYSIFTTLGERFLQVRWHRPDSEEAGEWAIEQQGMELMIRELIGDAIKEIFDASTQTVPELPKEIRKRIVNLAEVVAIGRTHVFRSAYGNREMEYVPEAEANTRISKGLAAIAKGIAAFYQRDEVAEPDLQDALRVGLDTLPPNRRRLLLAACRGQDPRSVAIARSVRDREIEELQALGLLEGNPPRRLSRKSARLLFTAKPELKG